MATTPSADTGTGTGTGAANRGTRSRAGNAMGRTREAALTGAVAAIAKYGARKATMGDIAMLAGIAKATLYNHFRTRDDVYGAVLVAQVDEIAAAASDREDFVAALAEAARLVAEHPALRKVVTEEPAVLVALLSVHGAELSRAARAHVVDALQRSGRSTAQASVGLVVSFLASQIFTPTDSAERGSITELISTATFDDSTTAAALQGQ